MRVYAHHKIIITEEQSFSEGGSCWRVFRWRNRIPRVNEQYGPWSKWQVAETAGDWDPREEVTYFQDFESLDKAFNFIESVVDERRDHG